MFSHLRGRTLRGDPRRWGLALGIPRSYARLRSAAPAMGRPHRVGVATRPGIISLGVVLLLAPTALAQAAAPPATVSSPTDPCAICAERTSDGRWPAFDLGVTTEAPISAGLVGALHGPFGLFVEGEVGLLPKPYFSGLNALVTHVGGYSDEIAALLEDAFDTSPVLRASLGLRPLRAYGLELFGGYSQIRGIAGLSALDVVAQITRFGALGELPIEVRIPLAVTLHTFHVGASWRWQWGDRLFAKVSLAYWQCIALDAALRIESEQPLLQSTLNALSAALTDRLSPLITSYFKLPVLGLTVGVRFD